MNPSLPSRTLDDCFDLERPGVFSLWHILSGNLIYDTHDEFAMLQFLRENAEDQGDEIWEGSTLFWDDDGNTSNPATIIASDATLGKYARTHTSIITPKRH